MTPDPILDAVLILGITALAVGGAHWLYQRTGRLLAWLRSLWGWLRGRWWL